MDTHRVETRVGSFSEYDTFFKLRTIILLPIYLYYSFPLASGISVASKMRILTLGDLHIKPSNMADVHVYLEKLEGYLQSNSVDLIVILGDTLDSHEKLYTPCMNLMYSYVKLCERYAETYVLVGNHEYINNLRHLDQNHPFIPWKNTVNIVDTPIQITRNHLLFTFCPYVPNGQLASTLTEFLEETWKESTMIFAHQSINGAKMGSITETDAEDWNGPFLVCGHIHDKQQLGNVYYPGSILSSSSRIHTIALFTVSDTLTFEEIDLQLPRVVTLKLLLDKPKGFPAYVPHFKYRFNVYGTLEQIKAFKTSSLLRQVQAYNAHIIYKPTDIVQQEVKEYKSFSDNLHDLTPTHLQYLLQMMEGHETQV